MTAGLRPDRVRQRCPGGFVVRAIANNQLLGTRVLAADVTDPLAEVQRVFGELAITARSDGWPVEYELFDGDTGRYVGTLVK